MILPEESVTTQITEVENVTREYIVNALEEKSLMITVTSSVLVYLCRICHTSLLLRKHENLVFFGNLLFRHKHCDWGLMHAHRARERGYSLEENFYLLANCKLELAHGPYLQLDFESPKVKTQVSLLFVKFTRKSQLEKFIRGCAWCVAAKHRRRRKTAYN